VDATGLRIANVQISCGGLNVLSSPGNTFTTTLNAATQTTTFMFTLQSTLLCGNGPTPAPTPTPSGPTPPSPPSEDHHGLTWGGVFLILFFVGLLVYALAAVGFNYYRGMRGAGLAPPPRLLEVTAVPIPGRRQVHAGEAALCGKGDGAFASSVPTGGGANANAGSGKVASGYSDI
jgi:hypothetical protein